MSLVLCHEVRKSTNEATLRCAYSPTVHCGAGLLTLGRCFLLSNTQATISVLQAQGLARSGNVSRTGDSEAMRSSKTRSPTSPCHTSVRHRWCYGCPGTIRLHGPTDFAILCRNGLCWGAHGQASAVCAATSYHPRLSWENVPRLQPQG